MRAAEPLTLADARKIALERNADFRIAQTQVDAALAQLRSAREFPNPVLGLSVSKINTDGRGNSTRVGNQFFERSYDSIASLSQFFELGKRGVRRASAQAGVRSAESLRDDARRLLLLAVSQTYVTALESQEEVRVLGKSAESLRKEASIAATRLSAGDISASDQAQIEIAAAQMELNASAAKANFHTAVVVVETLLAMPTPKGDTPLADNLDGLKTVTIDETTPVTSRPDILAAEAGVTKAESDLKLQRRGPVPDLTVSVLFERQQPDQPNTVGFGVSMPVPLWNRNTANILAAKAVRDQAQTQLEKVRVQASADVTITRLAYAEAQTRAETYLHQLRPRSAEITQTVAYAYSKGGASLVELLQAERDDNDIRLATARAQADAASAAVGLAAALNRLDPNLAK